MANRIVHFEVYAEDIERAKTFYGSVFGWTFEDYSQYVNSPYWGVVTGKEDEAGINGGMMLRDKPVAAPGTSARAFVCTIVVDNYDATEKKLLEAGGTVMFGKHALPGMAWQGYYQDTEGNEFGIHQPDPKAGLA